MRRLLRPTRYFAVVSRMSELPKSSRKNSVLSKERVSKQNGQEQTKHNIKSISCTLEAEFRATLESEGKKQKKSGIKFNGVLVHVNLSTG